ncbi:MAG TPA: glycosyltransferase [Thermoanaerobaculia bacterium]|nr:glycosyltransferase [Thermoanaerobaculia bacterium]
MKRVVVLAPEPIRPRMAGMGIRALELARTLSREFEVSVLVPNAEEEARPVAGPLPVVSLGAVDLPAAAAGADSAVVSGHAASAWFRQVPDVPVAADLYDPFPIENLHYAPALGPEAAQHDRAAMALALARADFFLCASPEQRLFYAGALYASGRIGPGNFSRDPSLERLLAVVPFGVPEEPARGDRLRGRLAAGVAAEGPLLLFGGVYDWNEPDLLLEAWPRLAAGIPDARLLFFENPNPESTPQRAYARTREKARELDREGQAIVFSPWLPYAERADLYAASDLLVSTSAEGLESDLAFRTRLLDAAWGGVPCVSVAGGRLAQDLERAGAGRCAARDPQALVDAIREMLARGGSAREAARAFAVGKSWGRVARPLVGWCRSAALDPGRISAPVARSRSGWGRWLSRA